MSSKEFTVSYKGFDIPSILYHGTIDRFPREHLEDGVLSTKKLRRTSAHISATPRADYAIGYGANIALTERYGSAKPLLLVINTQACLDCILDDPTKDHHFPEYVRFTHLREGDFLEVELIDPYKNRDHNSNMLELNRAPIENAIQEILGLPRTVPMELITQGRKYSFD